MGSFEELLESPLFIYSVLGGGALFVIILMLIKRRRGPQTAKGMAESGNYLAAAMMAKKEGKLEVAMEYFLIAKQPIRAAAMARMLGRHEQAGEMLESTGELEKAAAMFKEAGLSERAKQTLEIADAQREDGDSGEGGSDSGGDILSDTDYAARLDRKFKETLAAADSGSVEAQAELLEMGRDAAEACLAAGETERAAEIFRDAGLVDQAINLYVNLLGEFGEAASLMSKRGDHDRAAELYEQAGKKERALAAWIKWAEDASDPLENILSVDRLGTESTYQLLDTIIDNRPLANDTVDLHYRVAEAFEDREGYQSAMKLLESIQDTIPGYRDVEDKLDQLEIVIREGGGEDRFGQGGPGGSPAGGGPGAGPGMGGWSDDSSPELSPLVLPLTLVDSTRAAGASAGTKKLGVRTPLAWPGPILRASSWSSTTTSISQVGHRRDLGTRTVPRASSSYRETSSVSLPLRRGPISMTARRASSSSRATERSSRPDPRRDPVREGGEHRSARPRWVSPSTSRKATGYDRDRGGREGARHRKTSARAGRTTNAPSET